MNCRCLKGFLCYFLTIKGAIQLGKNPVFHDTTKHIDFRYHFIREIISSGVIKLEKVFTEENPADMATKVLLVNKFRHCLSLLPMVES